MSESDRHIEPANNPGILPLQVAINKVHQGEDYSPHTGRQAFRNIVAMAWFKMAAVEGKGFWGRRVCFPSNRLY